MILKKKHRKISTKANEQMKKFWERFAPKRRSEVYCRPFCGVSEVKVLRTGTIISTGEIVLPV